MNDDSEDTCGLHPTGDEPGKGKPTGRAKTPTRGDDRWEDAGDSQDGTTRKKIKITQIDDKRGRQTTFTKRKQGLIKKARELSVLCGCEIGILMTNMQGKLLQFDTGNMDRLVARFHEEGAAERLGLLDGGTPPATASSDPSSSAFLAQLEGQERSSPQTRPADPQTRAAGSTTKLHTVSHEPAAARRGSDGQTSRPAVEPSRDRAPSFSGAASSSERPSGSAMGHRAARFSRDDAYAEGVMRGELSQEAVPLSPAGSGHYSASRRLLGRPGAPMPVLSQSSSASSASQWSQSGLQDDHEVETAGMPGAMVGRDPQLDAALRPFSGVTIPREAPPFAALARPEREAAALRTLARESAPAGRRSETDEGAWVRRLVPRHSVQAGPPAGLHVPTQKTASGEEQWGLGGRPGPGVSQVADLGAHSGWSGVTPGPPSSFPAWYSTGSLSGYRDTQTHGGNLDSQATGYPARAQGHGHSATVTGPGFSYTGGMPGPVSDCQWSGGPGGFGSQSEHVMGLGTSGTATREQPLPLAGQGGRGMQLQDQGEYGRLKPESEAADVGVLPSQELPQQPE